MAVKGALVFALAFLTLPANAVVSELSLDAKHRIAAPLVLFDPVASDLKIESVYNMDKMGVVGRVPTYAFYYDDSRRRYVNRTGDYGSVLTSALIWEPGFLATKGLVTAAFVYNPDGSNPDTIPGSNVKFRFAAFKVSYNGSALDNKYVHVRFNVANENKISKPIPGNTYYLKLLSGDSRLKMGFSIVCSAYHTTTGAPGGCSTGKSPADGSSRVDAYYFHTLVDSNYRNFVLIFRPDTLKGDTDVVKPGHYSSDITLTFVLAP